MSGMNELEAYESRIREVAPEIQIENMSLNREGLMNDIVIVNGEIVFRFPKHEYSFKHLDREAKLLRLLRNYISLEIPLPLYESVDVLAYRLIPGETLRRDVLMRLPEAEQSRTYKALC